MSQDIQILLSAAGLDSTTFEPTSRYHSKPLTSTVTVNGETIIHSTRRFVPTSDNFSLLQYHFVEQGDRIDSLAYKYLADPQQFWKLCDANNIDNPSDLTKEVGSTIRITLPEGVPGGSDA